jgi:multidrug efflux pump subunit AcrB
VLGCIVLKAPKQKPGKAARQPYSGFLYGAYRLLLRGAIRFRWATILIVIGLFIIALRGFGYVDKSFFPDSTRPQFMVDFWLPKGTHIDDTLEVAAEVEEYLQDQDNVTHVTTMAGAGGLRFLLTYAPEKLDSSYLQFLVDVKDHTKIAGMIERIETELDDRFPTAMNYGRKFILGPGGGGKIQARFSGPDPDELRRLAEETVGIFEDDGGAKAIRTDWRNRVMLMRPVMADEEANRAGIGRPDVAQAIKAGFDGLPVGVYRDGDELLPIVYRAIDAEREDISSIFNLQVWSPAAQESIPLRQVVSGFETGFEDTIIQRLNRKTTITIHADPVSGPATVLFERVRGSIEALELPPGYELEWWGEYRDSSRAQAGIAASLPFFLVAMILIVIALFNALRQPLVIWLTVPLALIGVTLGLLVTNQPFGFMALLGFMSLSGMLIKNAIVLIDEIETQKRAGTEILEAIVGSGVSRLRPVAMAALTTALGMIPLLPDAFFVAMAVTIIFGLMIATVLTMIVVPVLYATFFGVKYRNAEAAT